MKRLFTVAAVALVTACAADARTEAPLPVPAAAVGAGSPAAPTATVRADVTCDIQATHASNGLRLEAMAYAGRAVSGAYSFVITAQGGGGSSDITQGGPFSVDAGKFVTVASAEISGAHYRAIFTLRDANGELCRSERQS